MAIRNVCVVGAGFMGSQIALQAAIHGYRVVQYDADASVFPASAAAQTAFLEEQVEAGVLDDHAGAAARGRLRTTTDLSDAAGGADLVIEAVREDLAAKRDVFGQLDRICPRHAILATNSSSIRVSRIESSTERPDRVLNTHFVQPVWKHNFVELMRGSATSDAVLDVVRAFMRSINVMPILVRREHTGFIFNCLWRALKKESLRMVDQDIASYEDVDRTWMIQMETPLGPFAMMDRVGLDVVRDIEDVYFDESGDHSDRPPRILLEKIERGELGVKTGRGFYDYPHPRFEEPDFLTSA